MNEGLAVLHLKQDPQLRLVMENTVLPPFAPSRRIYVDLLDSIVSQQLSTKVAAIIFQRFCALFPDNHPSAEQVTMLTTEQLRQVGLSGQKAAYLRNVALFALERNMEELPWETLPDEEITKLLTQIKGVGIWTTQMLLMFTLGRPDVFPVDDLGVQQAMIRLYGLQEKGKDLKKRMVELAEPWRPYRTTACRYLWRWKDSAAMIKP
jgi:DNA-3-methyladenine glycosylase II